MATATRQSATAYDLDMGSFAPFLQMEQDAPLSLSGLAPLRQVPVSLSDPTPRKRVVKDVLRVGKWKVGYDDDSKPIYWDVTPGTLRDLANNFTRMIGNGYQVNLCWGHGAPNRIGVDARDLIAPIDQAFVSGDRLWVAAYVLPSTALDLESHPHQVSIRALHDYQDGAGNLYPIALLHVAVVDHAVVSGQQPFRELANSQPTRKGVIDMADENTAPAEGEGGSTITELLRKLFAFYPPLALADDVNDAGLPSALGTLLAVAEAASGEDEEEEPAEGDPGYGAGDAAATPNPGVPADMANKLAKTGLTPTDLANLISSAVTKAVAPLEKKFLDLENSVLTDKTKAAKAAFDARLGELLASGHIEASEKASKEALGAKYGYDLALLPSGKGKPVIDMTNQSRRAADATPPTVGGEKKQPLEKAQVRELAASLGAKFKD
ncbi:MAG: hypothetical protein KGL39_17180 [Patescibacteria group bacterium]|nr:hypothetical protein [Patescibacteria group bacterium]